MAYRFFDSFLDPAQGTRRPKRALTLPVSIGIHVAVLAAVLVVPMLTFDEMPEPVMTGAIRAFIVEAAPPPPPPPPAAMAPRPMTAPKVDAVKKAVETPKFVA